jgi:uncharacterized repeat protein (TIGR03943 family)
MQAVEFRAPSTLKPDRSREHMIGWVKTALLIGLGLYFVYNIVSGNLANYINARFAWLSYVAAGIFLLLGLHSLYIQTRGETARSIRHQPVSTLTLFITSIPLILGTLVPSQPLGIEAINGSISTMSGAIGGPGPSAFTIPPEQRNVLDWLRAFNSAGDYNELNGLPADVIGFVYVEPTFGEDQFMVARFTVSCCVADASAIGLPVAWAEAASLPQGEWVRVRGALQVGEFRGDVMPILQAESIEIVEQPKHPYLYP